MEFANNLIYCISQTAVVIPKLFQATGFIGCVLASGSQVINAIHCIECWGLSLDRFIVPVFEKMREEIGGVFAK